MSEDGEIAVLFLTPACQLACPFCGADQGFEPLGWGRAVGLLRELKAHGVRSVVLGGGEPLLWRPGDGLGAADLAQEARGLGLLAQIGSNGLLAPRDEAGLHAFDRWILPLECMLPSIHESMRPWTRSHWTAVLALMERLRAAKVELTVSSLASAENAGGLEEVGAFVRDYAAIGGRVHAWHLYRFLPTGRGGALNAARYAMAAEDFAGLGSRLKRAFPGLTIYLRPDMYRSSRVSFHWQGSGALRRIGAHAAA